MTKTIVETDSGEYVYYGETLVFAGESVKVLYGESDTRREILSDDTFNTLLELVEFYGTCRTPAVIRANELIAIALIATSDYESGEL